MRRMSRRALAALALPAGLHSGNAVAGAPHTSQVTPRVEHSAVVVHGGRGVQGEGRSAGAGYARDPGPSTSVRLDLGAGREGDAFRQRTPALSVQYSR
ncbi:hypothetical protein GCM10027188_17200 [Lysobacter humi (ex Lee et al. 2017)]